MTCPLRARRQRSLHGRGRAGGGMSGGSGGTGRGYLDLEGRGGVELEAILSFWVEMPLSAAIGGHVRTCFEPDWRPAVTACAPPYNAPSVPSPPMAPTDSTDHNSSEKHHPQPPLALDAAAALVAGTHVRLTPEQALRLR